MRRPNVRPLRVAHVSPIAFGDGGTVGGGERYPTELARAMAKLTPTTLVTFGPRAVNGREGDLTINELPVRSFWRESALNPLSEKLVGVILRSDVIHVHQWESVVANVAVAAGRAAGKRVFATDHGGSARNYWRRLRLHRLLTGFMPVSAFAASFYPELADRSTVLYGGVDTDRYRPPAPDGSEAGRGRHALFVGRLLPHKGIDVLIESLDPTTELRVVGRPYDAGYAEHLAQLAVGKQVTFVWDADDEQVREEYRRARVLILPSLHHPPHGPYAPKAELLGLSLIEAMACGTPVICTRTGGMPEVVDGSSGRIVDPLDRENLGRAVTELSQPGDLWRQASIAARTRAVDTFSWSSVAKRCLSGYRTGAIRIGTNASPPVQGISRVKDLRPL